MLDIEELSLITSWQKKHIGDLLEETINEDPDYKYDEEAQKIIKGLKGYINRQRNWEISKLLMIDRDAIRVLDDILIKRIKKCVERNQKNEATLYLHALDFANGGVHYEGTTLKWLNEDIREQKNDTRMKPVEARFFYLLAESIQTVIQVVDEDIEKLPAGIDVDPVLFTYKLYDFEEALGDALQANDIKNLKAETLDIAARSLMKTIDTQFDSLEGDYLQEHKLAYVRTLSCCLNASLYDVILDTIDLS